MHDWKLRYADLIGSAADAAGLVKPGHTVFVATGCARPRHLLEAFAKRAARISDTRIVSLFTPAWETTGEPPAVAGPDGSSLSALEARALRNGANVGAYTPMLLSQIPAEFDSGRVPIDVAFISVTEPDGNGLCSLGISVDVVKSAAANARHVVAQVNAHMPRTFGNSFIHVNAIDMLVPFDEPLPTVPPLEPDETLRRIGRNLARLIEDESTIQFGVNAPPEILTEALRGRKDMGIHTEMLGTWILDLIECGQVTCARKTINNGKIVASFCMGSERLYQYVDGNPFFEFQPTEYVNDPFIIEQHERMISINAGQQTDLTGQVYASAPGCRPYSSISGHLDFARGCARSRGGKTIIVMPSIHPVTGDSRIVPDLTGGPGVVLPREDVQYLVTDYGVAYLHGRSLRERALALINVAHPKHRNELIQAAKERGHVHEDQIELAWEDVRYPEELERHDVLRDHTEVFFRPIKPTDEEALAEMLYSLSADSVRKRYFTHTKTFPHKDLQLVTNIDYERELAIVAVVPGPSGDEIVGIAQYFLNSDSGVAEVAFIVQDEWQAKGLGTLLLSYLTAIAILRRVTAFYATVLPGNKAMLSIFHNSGTNVKIEFDGDAYAVSCDLVPPESTSIE